MHKTNFVAELESVWPSPYRAGRSCGSLTDVRLNSSTPVELPNDYIDLLNKFGHGWLTIDGEYSFQIFDLTTGSTCVRPVELLQLLRDYEGKGTDIKAIPMEGGLLPWAVDDQGYTYFWSYAHGEVRCEVVTAESCIITSDDVRPFDISMTAGLYHLLSRKRRTDDEVEPSFLPM